MTNIALHCLTGDYNNVVLEDPFNDGISINFGESPSLNKQDIIFPLNIITGLFIMPMPANPNIINEIALETYNTYVKYIFLPLLSSYPELETLISDKDWNQKTYDCGSNDYILTNELDVDSIVSNAVKQIDENVSWSPGKSLQNILMGQNMLEAYIKETSVYRKLAIWLVAYIKYTGRINYLK